MIYILYALLAVGLVALDQWVKWWVTVNIPMGGTHALGEPLPFIPRILGLNHAHNTGGAWSMLNQHTWLLTAVSTAVVLIILFKPSGLYGYKEFSLKRTIRWFRTLPERLKGRKQAKTEEKEGR